MDLGIIVHVTRE